MTNNRYPAPRFYRGFLLSRDGGADAPWRAWREDGIKVRADTLAGVKAMVREAIAEESGQ